MESWLMEWWCGWTNGARTAGLTNGRAVALDQREYGRWFVEEGVLNERGNQVGHDDGRRREMSKY